MKLDDIVKNTIGEIAAEIASIEKEEQECSLAKNEIENEDKGQLEPNLSDEILFLQNTKERIEVLFYGLNQNDSGLELRLELSIKFLEFLLAKIEHRLQAIQK